MVQHGSILVELIKKMTEVLTKNQTQALTPNYDLFTTQTNIKLDDTNYAFSSQVVEMYISCKENLGYISKTWVILMKTSHKLYPQTLPFENGKSKPRM